jgi:hypothetical protein
LLFQQRKEKKRKEKKERKTRIKKLEKYPKFSPQALEGRPASRQILVAFPAFKANARLT